MARRRKSRKSHSGAKYKVVCGKATKSYHRKKAAAKKSAPKGCSVRKA